ncbi:Threonine dehydratase biosynthetic, chloroplastic [Dendrobium catenatum]|uniref:Threonine dehydratase biosynthetic, chloroplastic n=1 Tax=Dendrobium catenatum TaxID=906689 RepID=A0A2I0XIN1_9ASPA|nr:Threonine dehydratase biosynthetic, chloroplastic [Dendrobium catenatum]
MMREVAGGGAWEEMVEGCGRWPRGRPAGETGANVLVGLQVSAEDMIEFSYQANKLGYEYTYEMNNEAYLLLMQ